MTESPFYNNAIFWVDVDKIKPNPFQPRREFDQMALQALSDSIRQYGVLQALVVTRKELYREDGSMAVEYELIAGERRLRASKLAGLSQVPVLIRAKEDSDLMKLELAIIENIQREDLNAVDRAKAFQQLSKEFGFKHSEIADKVGKSREYVSNTIRILALPEHILQGLSEGKISEGHTRPLLMLADRPEEQDTLFKEIVFKRLNVREAEIIARKIAVEKTRKKDVDPELMEMEGKLSESLGTRVSIERKESGGRLTINFFSDDDLRAILHLLEQNKNGMVAPVSAETKPFEGDPDAEFPSVPESVDESGVEKFNSVFNPHDMTPSTVEETSVADTEAVVAKQKAEEEDDDLYSVRNFSL